jgi:uncharacterized DUF497 family protein
MKFEWDETKNKANLAKHGIDFDHAILVFFDTNRIEWVDERKDYRELRYVTIGLIKENLYCIVYTIREKKYRLISARGARKDEKQDYYNNLE